MITGIKFPVETPKESMKPPVSPLKKGTGNRISYFVLVFPILETKIFSVVEGD